MIAKKPLNILVLTLTCLCSGSLCLAQGSAEKQRQEQLFAELQESEKRLAVCLKEQRDAQIREFGKMRLPISGPCWDGCPTRVVKPYYPQDARRLRIQGEVRVETIVDEKGNVVFAKMIKGNALFRRAAEMAASESTYQPKIDCRKKPLKFRWIITYLFNPSM